MRYLLLNPRRVLTRAQLLDHVWSYDFGGDARVLETYVSYLRKKIDAQGPPLLHTVRGVGYALRLPTGMTMSLRTRLLAGMVALVAAGLAVAAFVTYEEQRSFLLDARRSAGAFGAARSSPRSYASPRRRPRGASGASVSSAAASAGPRALAILPPGTFGELRDRERDDPPQADVQLRRGAPAQARLCPRRFPSAAPGASPHVFSVRSKGRPASATVRSRSGSTPTRSSSRSRCERRRTPCTGSWSSRCWSRAA